jgi:hypothetical protein
MHERLRKGTQKNICDNEIFNSLENPFTNSETGFSVPFCNNLPYGNIYVKKHEINIKITER